MAESGVYPRGGPRPTSSYAEQRLHRALAKHLPSGWYAWHSLRVRAGAKREGEGDFVLAIPDKGILVMEVKGGAIEVCDGRWLQNGRPLDKAPRDQAAHYRSKLKLHLEKSNVACPWIAIGSAFPDTPFSKGPSEGAVSGAVIGQQDLPYLTEALVALAERLFANVRPPRDRRFIEALHSLWCETWTPVLSLGDRNRLRETELVALDEQQLRLLDMIEQNKRLLVTGGPGTGKTLVARELVRRLADKGLAPVFLCSTRALAAGLRGWGIERAWTVAEFAAELLERAKLPIQDGVPSSQWTSETWSMLPLRAAADALPLAGFETGAVVVDEGQDFREDDWTLCQQLAGDGVLWAFADAGQSFWRDRIDVEELLPASFCLLSRYRCPEPLAVYADHYRQQRPENEDTGAKLAGCPSAKFHGESPRPLPSLWQGLKPFDELRVVRLPAVSALEAKVAVELDKALGAGVRPGDIAVLSLAGASRSCVAVADRLGRHRVVRADDADSEGAVVADTFLRFKGLERPWVIVAELHLASDRYDLRMHVALSRATVGCVVLATGEDLERDPRLVRVS